MADLAPAVVPAPSTALTDPARYAEGVPWDELARLRALGPVHWVDELELVRHTAGGRVVHRNRGFWLVVGHQAVTEVSRATAVFSSAAEGAFLADPRSKAELERNRTLLINMDAPEHARMRKVVSVAFTPRAVRPLAQSVEQHATDLVARVTAAETFDVVADLAADLPLLVLADVLGMPREDRRLLFDWSNALVGFDDPEFGGGDIETFQRAFGDAFRYALELAGEKRRRPGTDLVSRVLAAEVDGRRLSEREFCMLWLLLVVAGNETTRNLLSGGLLALVEHPAERARLEADPSLVPTAVEELLRWVTPIMGFRRTVLRDADIDGHPVAEGDKVVLSYISANRDDTVFTDADRLDIGRDPNPHLAFGTGPHFCLGAALARLEAATLLGLLRPHLARLELVAPPTRLASNFMNALKSMPARFAPAPAS